MRDGPQAVTSATFAHWQPHAAVCVTRLYTAVVALGVEALLTTTTLPRTCRLLGIELTRKDAPESTSSRQPVPPLLRGVQDDVDWVYTRLGLPDTCLRRALTAGFRLRAYTPRLVIGVKKSITLHAHAWLVANGTVLDWAGTHTHYVPVR